MKKWGLFLLFGVLGLVLWMGNASIAYTREALVVWFEKLVPSLFLCMVLVRVLYEQGFLQLLARPFEVLIKILFHMDAEGFSLVLSSMLLGFPTGAVLLDEQTQTASFSEKSLRRILYTCSFATPGFLLLTCGSVLYGSMEVGWKLLGIQWVCGLLFLLFTRNTPVVTSQKRNRPVPAFMTSLTSALLESGKTLFLIGGYLMIFMTVCSLLLEILPSAVSLPLSIFSEFSNGVITIQSQTWSLQLRLAVTSMLLGFGGLCVHMQIRGMCTHLSYSYPIYLLARILQMIFAGILAYFIFA